VIDNTSCLVPYTDLREPSTFNLALGDPISVRISALNSIGEGDLSPVYSDGDIVRTEPLKPATPLTEGTNTDDSQIEVEWTKIEGADAGHDVITEYKVYWDNGSSGTNWLLIHS
jgi:hypothetical protein